VESQQLSDSVCVISAFILFIYAMDVNIFKSSVTTYRKLQYNDRLIVKYFELGVFVLFRAGLLPQCDEENRPNILSVTADLPNVVQVWQPQ